MVGNSVVHNDLNNLMTFIVYLLKYDEYEQMKRLGYICIGGRRTAIVFVKSWLFVCGNV